MLTDRGTYGRKEIWIERCRDGSKSTPGHRDTNMYQWNNYHRKRCPILHRSTSFWLFSMRFLAIQGSKICAYIKWNRWIHESGWRIFFHTNKRDTWVQPENNQKLLREYIRCNDFFHKALFSGSAQKQPFLLFKKQLGIDQWTNRRMDATSYRNAYHCPRRFKQFIRFPSG